MQPIWDGIDRLKNTPTLLFWGKDDNLLRADQHVPRARELMPHIKVHVLEQCGHIPQMEHAKKFNTITLEFLAD